MSLGICSGYNNTGIDVDCIIATDQEYIDAAIQYKKLDQNIVTGSRVVDWTQAEIDAYVQAQADAEAQAIQDKLDALDVSNLEIFTALIQRINVRIPSDPITKAELIQQIKDNRSQ